LCTPYKLSGLAGVCSVKVAPSTRPNAKRLLANTNVGERG
jgi:hypothetical protein